MSQESFKNNIEGWATYFYEKCSNFLREGFISEEALFLDLPPAESVSAYCFIR